MNFLVLYRACVRARSVWFVLRPTTYVQQRHSLMLVCGAYSSNMLCCTAVSSSVCVAAAASRTRLPLTMASHAGVRIDEDVMEGILHDSGCKVAYEVMEECLADHGRNWTKCQEQVKQWRQCMRVQQKRLKEEGQQPS